MVFFWERSAHSFNRLFSLDSSWFRGRDWNSDGTSSLSLLTFYLLCRNIRLIVRYSIQYLSEALSHVGSDCTIIRSLLT